jgi:hypothetical protein
MTKVKWDAETIRLVRAQSSNHYAYTLSTTRLIGLIKWGLH